MAKSPSHQPKPSSHQGPYKRVRGEIAALLGIDPDKASFTQRLRLDYATGLRLELDRLQARQLQGEAIDLTRFTNAAAELERLLPPADMSAWDMSKLSDDEVAIMEKIGRKATGEDVGEVVPSFKIEFVSSDDKAEEPPPANYAEAYLRTRIAELEAQLAAQSGPPSSATIDPPPSSGYQRPRLVAAPDPEPTRAEPESPEPKADKPKAEAKLNVDNAPVVPAVHHADLGDRMHQHLAIGPIHQPPQGWPNPVNEQRRKRP